MRWLVFILIAVLAVTLDDSFGAALRLPGTTLVPSVAAAVVAFVALQGHRETGLWAGLLIGLLIDLHRPLALGPASNVIVIGPWALGMLAGAYVVFQLRTLVFPRRPVSIGVMTVAAHATAALVVTAVYVIRGWYDTAAYPTRDSAVGEFFHQFGVAMYSGVIGVAAGWLLLMTLPAWGFQSAAQRMVIKR